MQGLLSNERIGNSSLWGSSGSNFKSIQRGVATISSATTNITITGVDLTKSIPRITFYSGGSTLSNITVKAKITSSTNLELKLVTYTSNVFLSWEIVEYNNVKSLQTGTLSTANSSVTQSVTSVVTTKSQLYFTVAVTAAVNTVYSLLWDGEITSSTLLTFNAQTSTTNVDIVWYLIEFN